MVVLRFICLLFVFIGVVVASAAAVLTAIIMLRFLPVLIVMLLACVLFGVVLKKLA